MATGLHSSAKLIAAGVAVFVATHSVAPNAAAGSEVPRLVTQTNPVEPFEARVALGKAAEQRVEFKAYGAEFDQKVGDHFARTMQSCFAAVRAPETDTFVLVADITREGKATSIEVRPTTNIALCFAGGFASAEFPPPPVHPDRHAYPVTIEMHIR